MVRIATFVFFDLETTGLPTEENNRTRITELSMVAVRRDHIIDQGELLKSFVQPVPRCPRVINKLTLCLNPRKMVSDGATSTTGLTNDLLEHQVHFNEQVFAQLDNFLNVLEKPVCLIAHNGMGFDFPILKYHLEKLNVNFSDDILCADSLYAVYDINEGDKEREKKMKAESEEFDEVDKLDVLDKFSPLSSMQAENEATPVKRKVGEVKRSGKRRKIFFGDNPKPELSYKVSDIYKQTVGRTPLIAHRAEDDCIMLVEIAVTMGEKFAKWLDEYHCLFCNIKPMSPGVSLGK